MLPLLWLLGGALLGAAIISICWSEISNWLQSKKCNLNDYAKLIREKLDNGQVRVVAGVFSSNGKMLSENAWTGEEDAEMKSIFDGRNQVRIDI